MSLRRPAKDQPETFEFNSSSLEAANTIVAKYPKGKQQSAVMALLYIAQRQNNNWIPLAAMKYIEKFLDISYIKVLEVANPKTCSLTSCAIEFKPNKKKNNINLILSALYF